MNKPTNRNTYRKSVWQSKSGDRNVPDASRMTALAIPSPQFMDSVARLAAPVRIRQAMRKKREEAKAADEAALAIRKIEAARSAEPKSAEPQLPAVPSPTTQKPPSIESPPAAAPVSPPQSLPPPSRGLQGDDLCLYELCVRCILCPLLEEAAKPSQPPVPAQPVKHNSAHKPVSTKSPIAPIVIPPTISRPSTIAQFALLQRAFDVTPQQHEEIVKQVQYTADPHYIMADLSSRLKHIDSHPVYNETTFPTEAAYEQWRDHEARTVKGLIESLHERAGDPSVRLVATVIAARNLPASKDANCSSYVDLTCGSQHWRGAVKKNTRSPTYNEDPVEFQALDVSYLDIVVYHTPRFGAKVLARARVTITGLSSASAIETWLTLTPEKAKYAQHKCEILVRLQRLDPRGFHLPRVRYHDLYRKLASAMLRADYPNWFSADGKTVLPVEGNEEDLHVVMNENALWLVRQFGLRYGVESRYRLLLICEILEARFVYKLRHIMTLEEFLRRTWAAPVPATRDESIAEEALVHRLSDKLKRAMASYQLIFPQNEPHGVLQKCIELFLLLGEHMRAEPLFQIMSCVQGSFQKNFQAMMMKVAPASDDQASEALSLQSLADEVLGAVYSDSIHFQRSFPPDFELTEMSATVYLDLLKRQLSAFCTRIAADTPSPELFGLYFKLVDIQERLSEFAFNFTPVPLTKLFAPFIQNYMTKLSDTMREWVSKACSYDSFETDEKNGVLHSTSAVDVIEFVRQALSFLQEFEFPSSVANVEGNSLEDMMLMLAKAITAVAQDYCNEMKQRALTELDVLHYEMERTQQKADKFHVSSQLPVFINNLQTCRALILEVRSDVEAHCRKCAAAAKKELDSAALQPLQDEFEEAATLLTKGIASIVDHILQEMEHALIPLVLCIVGDKRAIVNVLPASEPQSTSLSSFPSQFKPSKSDELCKRFNLPVDEHLIDWYSCVRFPRQGALYIFPNYLVFEGMMLKIVMPIRQLKAVVKDRFLPIGAGTSIVIHFVDGRHSHFTAMVSRDECFDHIQRLLLQHGRGAGIVGMSTESEAIITNDFNAEQLCEPLLSFLDIMFMQLREQLYTPIFTKVLVRTWGVVEEILLRMLCGDLLTKPLNDEQRKIIVNALDFIREFFHADGVGLNERYLANSMTRLQDCIKFSALLGPQVPSKQIIDIISTQSAKGLSAHQHEFALRILRSRDDPEGRRFLEALDEVRRIKTVCPLMFLFVAGYCRIACTTRGVAASQVSGRSGRAFA
eukprot:TRINITY_DN2435_c0_g1_i1.p1 TRINITY_DN2435_c0_g1~~TRINITY_DN2435_c0_g1_i1.p1  ORF type:complete len:1257 (-),score=297.48 TRINITY_DN2435_c0_g1_i1:1940-5710(-)